MDSILKEIYKIRSGREFIIDRSNCNRYRVVTREEKGVKKAYYFGVPIYNETTRKLLDMKFQKQKENYFLLGSNSNIVLGDSISFENRYGSFCIHMSEHYSLKNEKCIVYNDAEIYPTTNGVAFKVELKNEKRYKFRLQTDKAFYEIRSNNKYFALMLEKFKPFFTVSCIASLKQSGEAFAPAEISYQKINDKEFEVTVFSNSNYVNQVLFEVNLQEDKLFQDTTVESKNPKQNNAFGGTAFIGNTDIFGEQWLYSRPDFSKIKDILGASIDRAILYIPILNRSNIKFSAVGLTSRFCSFGSTWNNKKSGSPKNSLSEIVSGYHKIDVTGMVTENHRLLTLCEGWILKTAVKDSGFSTISTGDSFFAPQILEITFK